MIYFAEENPVLYVGGIGDLILISTKDSQLSNAFSPIVTKLLPKIICLSSLQLEKALSPISFTELGISKEVIFIQSLNVFSGI